MILIHETASEAANERGSEAKNDKDESRGNSIGRAFEASYRP